MASERIRGSRMRKIRLPLILMVVTAMLASCKDDPAGPEHEEDAIEPPPGLTVSNPIGAAASFSGAAASGGARSGAATDLTYVSASPGTFLDAEKITITNLATGESQTFAPADGGFDPVALEAEPGDQLRIVVQLTDQSIIEYTSMVPERRRPRVVRTVPPKGATEVVLSVAVMVVYSEPIDVHTVTIDAMQLRRDDEPVEGTLVVGDDGLRSWFTPVEPLQEATTYSLVVTTGVLDLQGDPLEVGVQATFTTGSGILTLSAGSYHTCAVRADGAAICWGDNTLGQCGRPFSGFEPPQAVPTTLRFTSVSSGHTHTCGVTVDGEAYCWGWNYYGQLGDGTTTDSDSPVRVSGGHSFVSLTTGTAHTCGLTPEGLAYCWGRHDYLQLGPGEWEYCIHDGSDWPCSRTPIVVGNGFKSLTAGHLFTCGLRIGGGASCWGGDHVGQLGTDSSWLIESCSGYRCTKHPQSVSGQHSFLHLSSGSSHSCGVRTDGTVYCWGKNHFGQLGAGFISNPMDRHATPLPVVGGQTYVSTAGGEQHTCALAENGQASCWGSNDFGQLGTGNPVGVILPEPSDVTGFFEFVSLSASSDHTCAIEADGGVYCWGANLFGQLGQDPSSVQESASPLQVPLLQVPLLQVPLLQVPLLQVPITGE